MATIRTLARIAALAAIGFALPSGAAVAPVDVPVVDATTAEVGPGWIGIRANADLLRMAGIEVRFTRQRSAGAHVVMDLDPDQRLSFETPVLAGQVFTRGQLRVVGGFTLRGPGGRLDLRSFTLVPSQGDPDRLDLVGRDGTAWLYLDPMMFGFEADWTRLLVPTADLTLTVAAAQRLGVPALGDQVIGEVRLIASVTRVRSSASSAKATAGRNCVTSPIWPGTPGFVADVFLINMPALQFRRCRMPGTSGGAGNDCDGPGGTNGEVVFTSAAHLKNRDDASTTADIPWHPKFQGVFPPYGNDQHPYLIGGLYRLDAQGRFEQVGRSAAKHAFFTTNFRGCTTSCSAGNVLGPGCEDEYTISNNDQPTALGPRREIIPASGRWGRCGSIYDDMGNGPGLVGCDGAADADLGNNGPYDNVMIVRETQIDPALNPGARYFAEAWYVIRDDSNIFNSMGYRELSPTWSATGPWTPGTAGTFRQGPALDNWVDPQNPGANARSVDLALADGRVRVASRATDLGGGRWRYDYAVMNFEFTRATTDYVEPNLKILTSVGLDGLDVPVDDVPGLGNLRFADGNLDAGDDWGVSTAGGSVRWNAGAAPTQSWGVLYAFGFEADAAPENGTVMLRAQSSALAPAGAVVPRSALFRDSFEDP